MPDSRPPSPGPDPIQKLRYGYYTPRWLYTVADLAGLAHRPVGAAFMGIWLLLVLAANPFGLPTGKKVVAAVMGVAVAGIGSRVAVIALIGFRGGFGLKPNGDAVLVAEFAPGLIRLKVKESWVEFSADEPHGFFMHEHIDRIEEARAEERARADGYGQQPDFIRRAFNVVLDRGVSRTILAEVAYEDQARDMVRHLHRLDAYARGGDGAGTLTRKTGQPGQTPTGNRPALD